jgi:hypothetical protein
MPAISTYSFYPDHPHYESGNGMTKMVADPAAPLPPRGIVVFNPFGTHEECALCEFIVGFAVSWVYRVLVVVLATAIAIAGTVTVMIVLVKVLAALHPRSGARHRSRTRMLAPAHRPFNRDW